MTRTKNMAERWDDYVKARRAVVAAQDKAAAALAAVAEIGVSVGYMHGGVQRWAKLVRVSGHDRVCICGNRRDSKEYWIYASRVTKVIVPASLPHHRSTK